MASIFERIGYQVAERVTKPVNPSAKVVKYSGAFGKLLNGDLAGAAGGLLDIGLGAYSSYGRTAETVALAGSSWSTLLTMFEQSQNVLRERTNLWHVLVEPIGRVVAPRVNLLATEVSYNGVQLGYDVKKIGSGFTHAASGADPIELTLTCYDVDGEIKTWFENLKRLHAHPDGTFGLPSEYANTFTITHGAFEEGRGYQKSVVLVPVSMQVAQTRKVDDFAELNLTFIEYESLGAL